LQLDDFVSWNLLHVYIDFLQLFFQLLNWFFPRETDFVHELCCILNLFEELVACCFLFMKFLACCYFSSWNSHIDFSSRETDFVHETCWVLIFYSRNLLYVDFPLRETCIFIFLLLKLILFMKAAPCIFLLVELVACWFLLVKLVYFSFQEIVAYWIFSWDLLRADFCL